MQQHMTFIDVCAGIGGISLGLERAGMTCIGQIEIDDYCTEILKKHWPIVPRWRDITTISTTSLPPSDVITGGYPCQPFSVAGKRKGAKDDRHLWPFVCGIVASVRPAWCLFENVAGHVSLGLDTVLSDLEAKGYAAGAFIIPACAVDAPHRRDRCVIVANTGGIGYKGAKRLSENIEKIVTGTTRAFGTIAQFPNGIDWMQRARESNQYH